MPVPGLVRLGHDEAGRPALNRPLETRREAPLHLWLTAALAALILFAPVYDLLWATGRHIAYLAAAPPRWQGQILGNNPWLLVPSVLAALAGAAGMVLLLLRSRWAGFAFGGSFIGWSVAEASDWLIPEIRALKRPIDVLYAADFPALILAFALYAWWMTRRGVLR